jgi:hypothetical protein
MLTGGPGLPANTDFGTNVSVPMAVQQLRTCGAAGCGFRAGEGGCAGLKG